MCGPVRNLVMLATLGAIGALGTRAAAAADTATDAKIVRGRQIASQVCSACHVVAADQKSLPMLVPPAAPFLEIANRPDATPASLRRFVATTHWDEKSLPLKMPNPSLTDAQIGDVVSYLLSLRSADPH